MSARSANEPSAQVLPGVTTGAGRWAKLRHQNNRGAQAGEQRNTSAQVLMAEQALAQFQSKWRPRLEFQMAKVVISYLQVIAVVRDVDLRFPERLQRMWDVQGSLSGWARVLAWDCLIPRSSNTWFHGTFGPIFMVVLLPFVFQALWSVIWIACFLWDRIILGHHGATLLVYLWKRMIVTALCVAFLFYPVVASGVLSIFTCIELKDDPENEALMPHPFYRANVGSFWVHDTSIRCWTGSHRCFGCARISVNSSCLMPVPCPSHPRAKTWNCMPVCRMFVISVGIPGLLFWCAGVPLLTLLVLYRQRADLHQDGVLAFYGFLYAGYHPRLFFWEVAVMLRKLSVVAATSLVSTTGSGYTRVTLCLGVVWVFLIAQVRCRHTPVDTACIDQRGTAAVGKIECTPADPASSIPLSHLEHNGAGIIGSNLGHVVPGSLLHLTRATRRTALGDPERGTDSGKCGSDAVLSINDCECRRDLSAQAGWGDERRRGPCSRHPRAESLALPGHVRRHYCQSWIVVCPQPILSCERPGSCSNCHDLQPPHRRCQC
jgi:hypothetical protein